jgi:hypothetical protein
MKASVGFVVVGAALIGFAVNEASARSSTYEAPGEDTCYVSTYIPNLVQENTRGRLFQGPRAFATNGVGGRVSGGVVRTGVEPALYIKTQRIVEKEHYTLSAAPCP